MVTCFFALLTLIRETLCQTRRHQKRHRHREKPGLRTGVASADDAIRISGDANLIRASIVDDAMAGGATWDHIVSEAAGSDWNHVQLMDPYDLWNTAVSNLVGANSTVAVWV